MLPPVAGVRVVVQRRDRLWWVVLRSTSWVLLEKISLAEGGYDEHRALARVIWRRLSKLPLLQPVSDPDDLEDFGPEDPGPLSSEASAELGRLRAVLFPGVN
jgi:hypothetical protein